MVSSGHMLVIGHERWLEVQLAEVSASDDTVPIVGGLKDSGSCQKGQWYWRRVTYGHMTRE